MSGARSDSFYTAMGCGGCLLLLAYSLACSIAAVSFLVEEWDFNIAISIILVIVALRYELARVLWTPI